jgi:hypothetical protein
MVSTMAKTKISKQASISQQADKNVMAAMRCAKVLLPRGSACDHTSFADRILKLGSAYRLLNHIR